MEIISVIVKTDADGAATAYSTNKVKGQIVGYFIDAGDIAATSDWTITTEESAQTIESLTNQNGDVAAVEAALTLAAVCFQERIKVVVAQGGDTKQGTIRFAVNDHYQVFA